MEEPIIISYYEKCLVNTGQTVRHQRVFGTRISVIMDKGSYTLEHDLDCSLFIICNYEVAAF